MLVLLYLGIDNNAEAALVLNTNGNIISSKPKTQMIEIIHSGTKNTTTQSNQAR